MLTIRFNRVGKKNRAQFRIVVQEHTVAPGGRHVEVLGSYDPHLKKGVFKSDKIKYWIEKGAQVSNSVYNLLVKQGIIKGKKRAVNIGLAKSSQNEISAENAKSSGVNNPKESEVAAETSAKAVEGEKEKPAETAKEEVKAEIKEAPKPEEKKEEIKKEEIKPEEKKEETKELIANAVEEVKEEIKK